MWSLDGKADGSEQRTAPSLNSGRSLTRSYERIRPADLKRLGEIARADRDDFFVRHSSWAALYSQRLLCVALCQGAALHFVNGNNGIKDFDVWSFFREQSGRPIPRRPVIHRDFGLPTFGTSPDKPEFIGRRVDLLLKSIDCPKGSTPIAALQHYLSQRRTKTARLLSEKAVVLIEPSELLGVVAWPIQR